MAIDEPLKDRIERFLQNVDEPYRKVEKIPLSLEQKNRIEELIHTIIELPDNVKMNIMQCLENSWNCNRDHGNVRRWGRAARGIAEYLLMPIEMDQVQRSELD